MQENSHYLIEDVNPKLGNYLLIKALFTSEFSVGHCCYHNLCALELHAVMNYGEVARERKFTPFLYSLNSHVRSGSSINYVNKSKVIFLSPPTIKLLRTPIYITSKTGTPTNMFCCAIFNFYFEFVSYFILKINTIIEYRAVFRGGVFTDSDPPKYYQKNFKCKLKFSGLERNAAILMPKTLFCQDWRRFGRACVFY